MSEPEPETWQTDALGLLEADPVRPPSEGLARRTRDVARALARSAEPAGALPVGARVGPYTLGEVLGRGGQATVYRATDDEGRSFAVKVPRPELVSRLAREAQILFHLDHPRIVRIERADMKADPPYIACRLLEGGTLAERLRKGPMSPPDVACLADQILEALIHGHEKGVVHRDLKPSNVLFDRQHDAQVADFGVGSLRLTDEHALGQTLVSVDVTRGAGTPLYMAPEQEQVALRVDGKVDGRADLYALGKLLYEALTGRAPRTIRPASSVVPRLDPRWDAFLFRLVEDRPQDRFPDAAAARQALRHLLLPPRPTELLRLEERRAALDDKAAATEQAYRNLEAKLGDVNQQFQARERALSLREAALRERGGLPVQGEEPGVPQLRKLALPLLSIGLAESTIVEMLMLKGAADFGLTKERLAELIHGWAREDAATPEERLRGQPERDLRRPPRAFVGEQLDEIQHALDGLQGAARGASAALMDDEGHLVAKVGFWPESVEAFAASAAAMCAAAGEVAKSSDGTLEYQVLSLESRATVLTIARISPGLRVALLGAGPPHRAGLRTGLLALFRAVHPGQTPRSLAFVRSTPEELEAPRVPPPRSFAVRAAPIVLVSVTALCSGLVIAGKSPTQVTALVGLGLGLLLGLTAGATLWALVTGRVPR